MLHSVWPLPISLATTFGISVDVFSSSYLDVSVQTVPRVHLFDSMHATEVLLQWVSPFGNPRIDGYLLLPEAYRSLSRPSSAPDAKAFALCSFSLELPIQFSSLELLEFLKQDHFFALKRFFPFRVVYPPFGEIVSHLLMHYPFWKDSINFSILSSLICSFL